MGEKLLLYPQEGGSPPGQGPDDHLGRFQRDPAGFENICEDPATGKTKPYVLHAEANAITKVAKSGNNSQGATLYVTDAPCMECAKLIIQAGIRRVVYLIEYSVRDGIELLRRAGVEVCKYDMP